MLCLRKTAYKTHTFKRNVSADYYYNKTKWRQSHEHPSLNV